MAKRSESHVNKVTGTKPADAAKEAFSVIDLVVKALSEPQNHRLRMEVSASLDSLQKQNMGDPDAIRANIAEELKDQLKRAWGAGSGQNIEGSKTRSNWARG